MDTRKQTGLTALELMITMTIIAILMATAFPALKTFSWNLRMKTAMDVLTTDLNFTRSRSVTLNDRVVICPSTKNQICSGQSSWQYGWIVFSDLNRDGQKQDIEPLHKHTGPTDFLSINSARSRNHLSFRPNGSAPGSNTSIQFCDKRGARNAGKIILSNTGRIRREQKGAKSTANCP